MSNKEITIDQILNMIPHRYPFLLVDKVVDVEPRVSAVGIKNVTMNEQFFVGHFPGNPIMPGVLIVEAMAQTAGILVIAGVEKSVKDKAVYFMSIENAKFRKTVRPGDTLHMHIKVLQSRGTVWKVEAEARVNDICVAEAVLTAMVVDK